MGEFYAGIGSRETPPDILDYFEKVAAYLAKKGFILRSGHAPGADMAFENGCDRANGIKEIYIPWKNFQDSDSNLVVSSLLAFKMAEEFHPSWKNLSSGAKKLQARNSHQVLGSDLNTLSKFIICWTKNGGGSGGTGQAIRIAKKYNIPVFDAGCFSGVEEVKVVLKDFLLSNSHLKEEDFNKR